MNWSDILFSEPVVTALVAGVTWLAGHFFGRKSAEKVAAQAQDWMVELGDDALPILRAVASRTATEVDDLVVQHLQRLVSVLGAIKAEQATPEQLDQLRKLLESAK
jgi:type II secretory pathway component PulK